MVEVGLQRIRLLGDLDRAARTVIANLDGAIGRQHLAARVGLKAKHGFHEQGMPDLGHALQRRAVRRPALPRQLDLEAEQLDAVGPVLDPLLAARQVFLDAPVKLVGNARQFLRVDELGEIVEPPRVLLGFLGLAERAAINRDRDAAVAMLDVEDVALLVDLLLVSGNVVVEFDGDFRRVFGVVALPADQTEVGGQTGDERHDNHLGWRCRGNYQRSAHKSPRLDRVTCPDRGEPRDHRGTPSALPCQQ